MGEKGKKAIDDMHDAFYVFLFGIIAIYCAYLVVESLDISGFLKYTIYGLLIFFIYTMRDKIKEYILDILKNNKGN